MKVLLTKELNQEEKQCRNNISAHIREVINDCDLLLSLSKTPDYLRSELTQVKQVMQQNIEHLEAGKCIDDMPVNFEVIDIEDTAPDYSERSPISEKNSEGIDVKTKSPKKSMITHPQIKAAIKTKARENTSSFFARVKSWLGLQYTNGLLIRCRHLVQTTAVWLPSIIFERSGSLIKWASRLKY
jgi:hypothetical protein